MKYDFRKKDVIRFRKDLTVEQRRKVIDFAGQHSVEAAEYLRHHLRLIKEEKPPMFTVTGTGKTQKTETDFLRITDSGGRIYIVQARYFKVLMRHSYHRLTNLFLD